MTESKTEGASAPKLKKKLIALKLIVLPTLLYACDIWTVYIRHARLLNHFHTTTLRKILGIKWQDKIPDTGVLARTGLPSIQTSQMESTTCTNARNPAP